MSITRREFVVSTGALVAAAALFGSAPLAFAQGPTAAELMRPGPLPDLVLGKADAPVTIIEYASMTCPHCATFHKTTYPALKTRYIDTGKVRFIFREFPLDPLAVAASMLARCAGGEKYIALIDMLFASQDKWAVRKPIPPLIADRQAGRLHRAGLRGVPGESEALDDIVAMRERGSKEFKVDSTPTFFVNGKMQRAAPTIEELEKQIAALSQG